MKPVSWIGDSNDRLKGFPDEVRKHIGHTLLGVQHGKPPKSSKIERLRGRGFSGVFEIKRDYRTDTYRAVYVGNLRRSIYVLHCFKKKAKRGKETPKSDIDLIRERLILAKECEENLILGGEQNEYRRIEI